MADKLMSELDEVSVDVWSRHTHTNGGSGIDTHHLSELVRWLVLPGVCALTTLAIIAFAKYLWDKRERRRRLERELVEPYEYVGSHVVLIDDLHGDDEKGANREVVITDSVIQEVSADQWEEDCCICLEEYSADGKDRFIAPKCYHQFHMNCISKWIYTRGVVSCPVCKEEFISGEKTGTAFHKIAVLVEGRRDGETNSSQVRSADAEFEASLAVR